MSLKKRCFQCPKTHPHHVCSFLTCSFTMNRNISHLWQLKFLKYILICTQKQKNFRKTKNYKVQNYDPLMLKVNCVSLCWISACRWLLFSTNLTHMSWQSQLILLWSISQTQTRFEEWDHGYKKWKWASS